jgi:hypothetical protein
MFVVGLDNVRWSWTKSVWKFMFHPKMSGGARQYPMELDKVRLEVSVSLETCPFLPKLDS